MLNIHILKESITALVEKETDAELLDFIHKLLLQEGSNDNLNPVVVRCG